MWLGSEPTTSAIWTPNTKFTAMEIKEIIKRVHRVCSEYLSVRKISFETYFDFETNVESMDLTIFYFDHLTAQNTNFSATVWSHDPAYSVELLLKELEKELVRFYPVKTKSLSIIQKK